MNLPQKVIASIKLPVDSIAIVLIILALAKEWPEVDMRRTGEFIEFLIEDDGDENNS